MQITFADGTKQEFTAGQNALMVLKEYDKDLLKKVVAIKVGDQLKELNAPLDADCNLETITFEDDAGKEVFWHSSAHLMAQAVQNLFPGTRFGIGPAIKEGFYYDFDSDHIFTPEDLLKIEKEMKKLIKQNPKYERQVVSRAEALQLFADRDEKYKVELINDLPADAEISIYQLGDFIDLCAGPHLPSAQSIKAFKLLSLAGAYWRGSEKNKMLQRIYAVSFPDSAQLDDYLYRLEEAKKRDHRKLGQELDLFMFSEAGPGFPIFLPKGMILRNQLEQYWRELHQANGYDEVKTPVILSQHLWEQSGHWDHYQNNMYFTSVDEQNFAIKPMNCPGGMLVYKHKPHSYRELPIRSAELGLVHRHELSGALHGLMRVRSFIQDDAHIFMTEDQIKDEIIGVTRMIDHLYKLFGFKYHVELSTRPEKAMGSPETWEIATQALADAMQEMGMEYRVNEGDGAFYGPKLDFRLEDSLGRTWQCGTIQLDFQMPEKFDLTYTGPDNQPHRPVMIHRVLFGSIERFIGILIEHYAGAFPLWLAPVQAKILTITDRQNDYALNLQQQLKAAGIRAEIDDRNEKIGYKIRAAQAEKVPYMLVLGDQEQENGTAALRQRLKGDIGALPLAEIVDLLQKENADKV